MAYNRDYLVDLADPSRPTEREHGVIAGRIQKHPATFQCTLCPKRFTRAFNLRSHLRTHIDERPFVCTVCGKAFARQNDRKTHEELHSGEKKFVCRGILDDGETWGCGRRFAQAKNLGRHFRSDLGKTCIAPLVEEEARKRNREETDERQAASRRTLTDVPHNRLAQSNNSESRSTELDTLSRMNRFVNQWPDSTRTPSNMFRSEGPRITQHLIAEADQFRNLWGSPYEREPIEAPRPPPITQEPSTNNSGSHDIVNTQDTPGVRPEYRSQVVPEATLPSLNMNSTVSNLPPPISDTRAPMPPIDIKTMPLQMRVSLLEDIMKRKGIDIETELQVEVSPYPSRSRFPGELNR